MVTTDPPLHTVTTKSVIALPLFAPTVQVIVADEEPAVAAPMVGVAGGQGGCHRSHRIDSTEFACSRLICETENV